MSSLFNLIGIGLLQSHMDMKYSKINELRALKNMLYNNSITPNEILGLEGMDLSFEEAINKIEDFIEHLNSNKFYHSEVSLSGYSRFK